MAGDSRQSLSASGDQLQAVENLAVQLDEKTPTSYGLVGVIEDFEGQAGRLGVPGKRPPAGTTLN